MIYFHFTSTGEHYRLNVSQKGQTLRYSTRTSHLERLLYEENGLSMAYLMDKDTTNLHLR